MSVLGMKTVREIAKELRISQTTVISDIRHESQRCADELAERRESEQAIHLARVDDFYRKSMQRADTPGTGALGAAGKALEMRAKILGLDAPTKVELGLTSLLDALEVPDEK